MKIIWFSRHPALPRQIDELKRLFGPNTEIIADPNPFSSADDVVRRFKAAGANEMVIVAPLSVIGSICERGIKPLWAEMELAPKAQAEVSAGNRHFRFVRFRRVKKLALEFEDL